MEMLGQTLPIIIYFLLIVLLIILVVLVIRALSTLKKVDKIVDSVGEKIETLNGAFGLIDMLTDKISALGDFVVNIISNKISSLFAKKRKKKEEEEYYEE